MLKAVTVFISYKGKLGVLKSICCYYKEWVLFLREKTNDYVLTAWPAS